MNICFIGGGNMAIALIGGLLQKNFTAPQLRVVEISAENRSRLQQTFGVQGTAELAVGIADSEIIVLAVKPQQLREVALQLAPVLAEKLSPAPLLISIAAGIRAADLARWLGTECVVRAMPNTPALIQNGITGLYALPSVSPAQREAAQTVLSAVGDILWLEDETMMDAVTAISGSGPAYVFYFIEALQQAAGELGFDAQQARHLAIATFRGASKLADVSDDDVSVLRARVTSKNGTTERALLSMEENGVKQDIVDAVHLAAVRSAEMGEEMAGERGNAVVSGNPPC